MFTELMKTRTAPLIELAEKGAATQEETSVADKEKEQKMIDEQVKLAEDEGLTPKSK